MRKTIVLLVVLSVFGIFRINAQTDPGLTNLKHQWTFDDGTANDAVTTNSVNGTLTAGASIVNKALKLSTKGQYLSFSGTALALNTYPVITQEIWYTSVANANTGYTILSYFGNTTNNSGYNYISTSTARGDNKSRTAITDATYASEIGANGTEYDDGVLHHMISIIRADSVILYIDGIQESRTANSIALSTLSTSLAYLGKGGYTADPTWIGSIHKYSIYDKSLNSSEVQFLYEQGAEATQPKFTSVNSMSFDERFKTDNFTAMLLNPANPTTITAPSGITVNPSTFSASRATITVTYDGTSTVNGYITITNGTNVIKVAVKSYSNSCYTSLGTNLIDNPYVDNLSNFSGSGNRSINTDPTYVYCGSRSGKINSGSLEKDLTGIMKPNTTYRVKAKVYKPDQMMGNITYNLGIDPAVNPTEYALIKTAMDSACYYYNRYTPFSANIYVYYNAGIPTAQASYSGSIGFGPNQRYMWVGTAMHEMDHYFGSGTTAAYQSHMVNGVWNGTTANTLIKTITGGVLNGDSQHFWPYGINQKEEITNLGSMAIQTQALIDNARIAKAMLVDDCGLAANAARVGVGVSGYDVAKGDIYNEVSQMNSWQDIDFVFTTGATLKDKQSVYFNSGKGYIDNWEVYELPAKIETSTTFIALDENVNKVSFTVNSNSLSKAITITTPEGITTNISSIPNNVSTTVEVSFDGLSPLKGFITLTSGSLTQKIRVIATKNTDCFSKLYPDATNLIPDPYVNTLANFAGSGNRDITTDTNYVYCGSRCGKVWGVNAGSLDVNLTGKLLTNSTYRVKAKVYTIGSSFQIGTTGTGSDKIETLTTSGSWQNVDFTFTTGATLATSQSIYFNNNGKGDGTGYIDNWEMYCLNPQIATSTTFIGIDENSTTTSFSVTGISLTQPITITAPDGITLSNTNLEETASGVVVNLSYNGQAVINGNITLTSGTVTKTIQIYVANNTSCFTPLYVNIPNLITNPYLNTITSSWGKVSIVKGSDAYCGLSCAKISGTAICYPNGGSIASNTITWLPNTTYRIHAKVKTVDGTFNMGVQNANVGGASGDYDIAVPNTNGTWTDFDATFTTGGAPSSGVVYFNNCGAATGLNAYLDNWELYSLQSQIATSTTFVGLDEVNPIISFTVTGMALTQPITISAPNGITLSSTSLDANASGTEVIVTYSGQALVNGNITLTSGTITKTIQVYAADNTTCFSPLYTNTTNLITNPYLNTIVSSWGKVSIVKGSEAYCGLSCAKISGTGICQPRGGSIASNSIAWLPNTTYRIHAKVKTIDGTFNMSVQNANVGGASGDYDIEVPNTNNVWTDFDATFTTGAAPATGAIYFNNCGVATGLNAYLDNWELYVVKQPTAIETEKGTNNPKIYVSGNTIISDFTLSKESDVEFFIYDLQGKLIKKQTGHFTAGNHTKNIDSALLNGVYLVKVVSNEFVVSDKIVIIN